MASSLLDQINEVLKAFEEESKTGSGPLQQRRQVVYYPLPGQYQRPQPQPQVQAAPPQAAAPAAESQPEMTELGTSLVDEIKPSVAEIQASVVDEIKTLAPEVRVRGSAAESAAASQFPFNLQPETMVQGIILSEILGKPLAKRPAHGRRF